MTKMLVLSNKKIWGKIGDSDIIIDEWKNNETKLSDFGIVVLDMDVGKFDLAVFSEKREEITKILNSGGIVICLNHKDKMILSHISSYHEEDEYNYSWLSSKGNMPAFGFSDGIGSNYTLLSKDNLIKEYFSNVKQYYKTMRLTKFSNREGTMGFGIFAPGDTDVFATVTETREPIAMIVKVLNGSLIFLPQNELLYTKNGTDAIAIKQLFQIGNKYYDLNKEDVGDVFGIPDWIEKYKLEQQKDIEKQIKENADKTIELKKANREFNIINMLLYGSGKQLEHSIKYIFQKMGCSVEKTESGAKRDLIINTKYGIKFTVEVTSSKGIVGRNDKNYGQLLQHLQIKEDSEKLLFIANAYRDEDLSERTGKDAFSKELLDLATRNDICVLTTLDIFNFYKKIINGSMGIEEIIKIISNTSGQYDEKIVIK
ncbi:MAG: hypothetical protein KJ697_04100 [Nanoarchaeota archaeon]|nr:hypothetical protein [Nanoarchaeota archaeon]